MFKEHGKREIILCAVLLVGTYISCAKNQVNTSKPLQQEIKLAVKAQQKPERVIPELSYSKLLDTQTSSVIIDMNPHPDKQSGDILVLTMQGSVLKLGQEGYLGALYPDSRSPVGSVVFPCSDKVLIAYPDGNVIIAELHPSGNYAQYRTAIFSLKQKILEVQIDKDSQTVMFLGGHGAFIYGAYELLDWFEQYQTLVPLNRSIYYRNQNINKGFITQANTNPLPSLLWHMKDVQHPARIGSGSVWFLDAKGFLQKKSIKTKTIDGEEQAGPIGKDLGQVNAKSLYVYKRSNQERLVVISSVGEALIYDAESGQKITSFDGATWRGAAISPKSDKMLLFATENGRNLLINLDNYQREAWLLEPEKKYETVAALFDLDGKSLYTIDEAGPVLLYPLFDFGTEQKLNFCGDTLISTKMNNSPVIIEKEAVTGKFVALKQVGEYKISNSDLLKELKAVADRWQTRFKVLAVGENSLSTWTPDGIQNWGSYELINSISYPKNTDPLHVWKVSPCIKKSPCFVLASHKGEIYTAPMPNSSSKIKKPKVLWNKVGVVPKEYARWLAMTNGYAAYLDKEGMNLVLFPLQKKKPKVQWKVQPARWLTASEGLYHWMIVDPKSGAFSGVGLCSAEKSCKDIKELHWKWPSQAVQTDYFFQNPRLIKVSDGKYKAVLSASIVGVPPMELLLE